MRRVPCAMCHAPCAMRHAQVMLSGESAMGQDPVGTVQWMGRIIAEAEAHADDVSPSF